MGALVALASFHFALESRQGWWVALFPFAFLALGRLPTPRWAFYGGTALGFGLYGPPLGFFGTIFGPAAVLLWGILAGWIGLFLVSARVINRRCGTMGRVLLVPLLWTGLEYFRSEVYFLRFSWLTPGFVFAGGTPMGILPWAGVYGTGLLLFLAAALFHGLPGRGRWTGVALAAGLVLANQRLGGNPLATARGPARELSVAAAQIESIDESNLVPTLDQLLAAHPSADLVVLPEYSLLGEPSADLRSWCRTHRRHLVVGGTEKLADGRFRNTAWVVGPDGTVVFRQAKSVPIQFFNDGLPADSQALWESPWGPLGLAVCYDLSYARVIDGLVRRGAVGLIVPTMDALSWGERQHALHSRIAPLRSAEYGLPIIRCASSGVSQMTDARGRVTASAPTDSAVRFLAGTVRLAGPGFRPADRWLAPAATVASALVLLAFALGWKRTAGGRGHPTHCPAPTLLPG